LFSRVAMIVATSLILPIALWMGSRGVSTIDEIAKKIDAMKEASIEQAAEIRAQQRILADHEARVRVLEAQARQGVTR
jgi:galactitol-specific phosphotransferase system IIC component